MGFRGTRIGNEGLACIDMPVEAMGFAVHVAKAKKPFMC